MADTVDRSSQIVEFVVKDRGTAVLGGISRAYETFQTKMTSISQKVRTGMQTAQQSGVMQGLGAGRRGLMGGFGSVTQGLNLGITGGSIGSAAMIGAIARNFAKLEEDLVDTESAIEGLTKGELKDLKDLINSIGAEFPASTTDVGRSVSILGREKFTYDMIRSQLRNIILADLTTQTKNPELTTRSLISMQRSANAGPDQLMQTIDRAVTTKSVFGLNATLENLGDIARRTGMYFREYSVSQEEQLAIGGAFLKEGFTSETASTTIEALFRDIQKKGIPAIKNDPQLAAAFMGSDLKFNSILEFIDEFNKRNLDPYKLFEDESRRGLLALSQNRDMIRNFMENKIGLDPTTNKDRSAGKADAQFEAIKRTFQYQLDALIGDLENLGNKLAESGLIDILRDVINAVSNVVEEIAQWPQYKKELIVKGLLFGAISGPLFSFMQGIVALGMIAPPLIVLTFLKKLVDLVWWVTGKIKSLLPKEFNDFMSNSIDSYFKFLSENVPSIWELMDKAFATDDELSQSAKRDHEASSSPMQALDRYTKALESSDKNEATLFIEFLNSPPMQVRSDNLDGLFPNTKLGFYRP